MDKITVDLVIEPTIDPRALVGGLARLTQFKESFQLDGTERGARILNSITTMGHTSLLEPVRFGFIIGGASRVLLAQITRHRLCTFVSQSQQYQLHIDFPYVTIPDLRGSIAKRYHELMATAAELYEDMVNEGIDQDQARYVIPNAARNDLFLETNARELISAIFPQRLCRRNTLEVRYTVGLMLKAVNEKYPYLVEGCGPACITAGRCDQGKMSCGKPFDSFEEMLNE